MKPIKTSYGIFLIFDKTTAFVHFNDFLFVCAFAFEKGQPYEFMKIFAQISLPNLYKLMVECENVKENSSVLTTHVCVEGRISSWYKIFQLIVRKQNVNWLFACECN